MKLYCDITNQRFAQGFRNAAEPRVYLTQNDEADLQIFLVEPNPQGGRFPFMYADVSGKSGLTATIALANPGGTPLTLVAPVTFDSILHGFSGTLPLNTDEIATFLTGHQERTCALVVEVTDGDGKRVTSFVGYVWLRMAATEMGTVSIPGVIRKPLITGYTGGGSTNLDGLKTVGKTVGTIFWVKINGAESHWEYTGPGSTPSDPDSGIILTEDGGQLVRTIGV